MGSHSTSLNPLLAGIHTLRIVNYHQRTPDTGLQLRRVLKAFLFISTTDPVSKLRTYVMVLPDGRAFYSDIREQRTEKLPGQC